MRWNSLFLLAALGLGGCASTHLSGEYRTEPADVVHKGERRRIAKGNEWMFFWGILDTGSFNLDHEIKKQLRADEVVTDLEITDRLSVGGAFLWIITAGIVSHHSIVADGSISLVNRPPVAEPASPGPPAKEKPVAPAGGAEQSADYKQGYRDGRTDSAMEEKDRPSRSGRTSDYESGYRDGLKDAGR